MNAIMCPSFFLKAFFLTVLAANSIFKNVKSQVIQSDSMALIRIIDDCCLGCDILDSNSSSYWDLNQPVSTWTGVFVNNSRVIYLNLADVGLQGDFPNIDELSSLFFIQLSDNQLSSVDSIGFKPNLVSLGIEDNMINSLGNLEGCPSLQTLYLQNNDLEALPELKKLGNLSILQCQNNQLELLPSLDSLNNILLLNCEGNDLDSLPGILGATSLSTLICRDNALSFEDLSPIVDSLNLSTFLYEPQKDIPLTLNDSLLLLFGDTIQLTGTEISSSSTQFQWFKNGISITGEKDSVIVIFEGLGNGEYTLEATDPNLPLLTIQSAPVSVTFSNPIKCDNNNDGRRDMLDLVYLGLNFDEKGPPREEILLPQDTSWIPGYDWLDSLGTPIYSRIGGDSIELKTLDRNGDGQIGSDDFECVFNNYEPLRLSRPLLSYAVQDTISLRATPIENEIGLDSLNRVRVPYRIEFSELPVGKDSIFLRGIVFVRGVIDDNIFEVDTIYGRFKNAEFSSDSSNILGAQVFHPNLVIDTLGSSELHCLDFPAKQLDVGLIRTNSSKWVKKDQAGIICEVLGDARINGNTGFSSSPIIPVLGDVNTVILYLEDPQQRIVPVLVQCTSDTAWIAVDSLYNETFIAGGVHHVSGAPIPHAQVIGISLAGVDTAKVQANGDFMVRVSFGDTSSLWANCKALPNDYSHVDISDLLLLEKYLNSGKGLNAPSQLLAADIDQNGEIGLNDYLLLRDFVNKGPGKLFDPFWKIFNPEFGVNTNPFIQSVPTRNYLKSERKFDQDFSGVLVGDIDISWSPASKKSNKEMCVKSQNEGLDPILIYPNPFYDKLNIQFVNPQPDHSRISIVSLSGQLLFAKNYKSSKILIEKELESIPIGQVLLLMVQTGEFCHIEKLIRKK